MNSDNTNPLRKPDWLKIRLETNQQLNEVRRLVRTKGLHTVCESARCPNTNECWGRRTATFLLLGDVCTRNCRFCAVAKGRPALPEASEPLRIAQAVQIMGLKYVVLTSVTRDDLPDGGASHWAATISAIRRKNPDCSIEVLIPDFKGKTGALETVLAARPDVVGHNMETVKELYARVRPMADYELSRHILRQAKEAGFKTKTGIMVGMGETNAQIKTLIQDVAGVGCDILTIGQYLQPTPKHLPVIRYVDLEVYNQYRDWGREAGIGYVFAGPLVRSSYHADEVNQN